MAKKEDKKTKKLAKSPEKEVKKAEEKETKVIKKDAIKAEVKPGKKPEPKPEVKRETKVIEKPKVEPAKKAKDNTVEKIAHGVKPKKAVKETKFEEKKDLDKLYVYFTIVNAGVASSVVKVFEEMGCSVSFVQNGIGTASEEVKKALHIQDSRKEVVISIIRESRLEDIEKELAAFFLASRRNKGVAFATKMDAIQGVRLYKFLSQTL